MSSSADYPGFSSPPRTFHRLSTREDAMAVPDDYLETNDPDGLPLLDLLCRSLERQIDALERAISLTQFRNRQASIKRWTSVADMSPESILGKEDEDEEEEQEDKRAAASKESPGEADPKTDPLLPAATDDAGSALLHPSPLTESNQASALLRELARERSPIPALASVAALSPVQASLILLRKVSTTPRRIKNKTKIICAVGPACRSKEMLGALLDAGMNVARLNFSHGTHEYHEESLRNLRAAVAERNARGIHCRCAVLMDTKGPEIRTGRLRDKSVHLSIDDVIEITCRDYDNFLGTKERISLSYEDAAKDLVVGGRVLVADGELSLLVLETHPEEGWIKAKVENDFVLGEKKNVNLPNVRIRLPGITEKDLHDITHFALKQSIDIISGSFTRSAANVRALRDALGDQGRSIRVHAKIESVEALHNLDEIIREADGVHVSRGDLGMELPLAKLALVQKAIIARANAFGRPVVTSTQTLQSMTTNPRPSNAECTDVANAVLDGTDCIMLSAETASGKYPREAVSTMVRIIHQAERLIRYDIHPFEMRDVVVKAQGKVSVVEAVCSTAVETARELNCRLIVVVSEDGNTGLLVAKYRPRARVLLVTKHERVANQMAVSRGVEAVVAPSLSNLDLVWDFVLTTYLIPDESPFKLAAGQPVVLLDSPPASYDTVGELAKVEDVLYASNKQGENEARWNMVRVMHVPSETLLEAGAER